MLKLIPLRPKIPWPIHHGWWLHTKWRLLTKVTCNNKQELFHKYTQTLPISMKQKFMTLACDTQINISKISVIAATFLHSRNKLWVIKHKVHNIKQYSRRCNHHSWISETLHLAVCIYYISIFYICLWLIYSIILVVRSLSPEGSSSWISILFVYVSIYICKTLHVDNAHNQRQSFLLHAACEWHSKFPSQGVNYKMNHF